MRAIPLVILLAALPAAHAEIPGWAGQLAAFWGQGLVPDAEFEAALQYMEGNGAPRMEAASLPFVIGAPHTVQGCEITIHGASGGTVLAESGPGRCDIKTYEEASGTMIGGIRVIYGDGGGHIVYTPWEPFDGDLSGWTYDHGEAAAIEIVYHDLGDARMDAFGTIYFDENGVSAAYIPAG